MNLEYKYFLRPFSPRNSELELEIHFWGDNSQTTCIFVHLVSRGMSFTFVPNYALKGVCRVDSLGDQDSVYLQTKEQVRLCSGIKQIGSISGGVSA